MIGWQDCPHIMALPQSELDDMAADLQPHQKDARMKGKPSLGAGAIYPVPEESILVDPFDIPHYWPRGYGMDVGWKKTASVWGAMDPEQEKPVFYLTGEYYVGEQQPVIHSQSIIARSAWQTGAIDPASNGRGQKDGSKLFQEYTKSGLKLIKANNTVEAGLYHVLSLMQTGRLKVFRGVMQNWLNEYRLYRRDEKGKIVKENDHLMDAMRYLLFTAGVFKTMPIDRSTSARSQGEW